MRAALWLRKGIREREDRRRGCEWKIEREGGGKEEKDKMRCGKGRKKNPGFWGLRSKKKRHTKKGEVKRGKEKEGGREELSHGAGDQELSS